MEWKNELTELLQVHYPIVQAPMLGVSTPEMVAIISNLGGLGSLPIGGLSPEKTRALIRKTKTLTEKPFAVNLFVYDIPDLNIAESSKMEDFLHKMAAKYGMNVGSSNKEMPIYSYQEQIKILLEENVPIVSFTFGMLDKHSVQALKEKGTLLIGTATCVKEALLLDEKGIDIVTAQGIEAGGHRGTFLENEPLPTIGLFSLLPQLAKNIRKPILAAGGIYNGKTMQAAFSLGAAGVQIGTAFIASDESSAIPSYKNALQESLDTDSMLTKAFTGRWARGLRNAFITEVESSGIEIPAYPFQNRLTSPLRALSQEQDNKEFTNLWAGQSASMAEAKPTADIFLQLIEQMEEMNGGVQKKGTGGKGM